MLRSFQMLTIPDLFLHYTLDNPDSAENIQSSRDIASTPAGMIQAVSREAGHTV
ncbi:hypothetical protein [Novacetimonas hansenii]|uniref:Uncharacterized protein n=1 Tax=Novacetimonas hansenii TaxID=436 RepID=A0ABQ0SIQ7_NOVHA|nr:hypothetical protein [Novacetimonas hansenii]GAN84614.1 hypothetical protein Gaha_0191_003 [Novacetimonas hansenii JCM 7643]GEC64700.1 hypothetical protein GHA01_25490 [Novacetimonas hansenii]